MIWSTFISSPGRRPWELMSRCSVCLSVCYPSGVNFFL